MTSSDVTLPPKRLHILDDEEIEALYGRPCFTGDERTNVFTLTQPEKDLLASFTHIPIQLYFILQLGYFKTKQLFFTFTFDDVVEDVTYLGVSVSKSEKCTLRNMWRTDLEVTNRISRHSLQLRM